MVKHLCHAIREKLDYCSKRRKQKSVSYKPFTIQLLYGSSGYKQEIDVGVDLGAKHTGIAITSNDNVLVKGEIEVTS